MPVEGIGSAVASGAAGIAGAVGSAITQKRQFAHDTMLNAQQFGQNIAMWRMQNAYNSPTAQMQRLQEAGLNPALIYGKGGAANAGNAPGSPAPVKPIRTTQNNHAVAAMQAMSMYQDLRMKTAQVDNVNAQTENAKTQNIGLKLKNGHQELVNNIKKVEESLETGKVDGAYVGPMAQRYLKLIADAERASYDSGLQFERYQAITSDPRLQKFFRSEIDKAIADAKGAQAQAALIGMKKQWFWLTDLVNPTVRTGANALGVINLKSLIGAARKSQGQKPATRYTDKYGPDGNLLHSTVNY